MIKKPCNKLLLFICITEGVFLLYFFGYFLLSILPPRTSSGASYVYAEEPGFIPEDGIVTDAKTAEAIGRAVIDHVTGRSSILKGEVYFNREHNVWIVRRSYFFSNGASVYIDPQTGKIIKMLYQKN